MYHVTKYLYFKTNQMLIFWTSYSKTPKKYHCFQKKLKQHNFINIKKRKLLLEHRISIIESFLKDHVPLKTRLTDVFLIK